MNRRITSIAVPILVGAALLVTVFLLVLQQGSTAQAGRLERPAGQLASGDLAVAKWSSAFSGVEPGGLVTYYVSYTWDGAEDATNVRLTDTLPSQVAVISSDPEPAATDGQQLIFDVGTISPDTWGGMVQIVGRVDAGVAEDTTITNTVRISGDVDDTNPDNNEAHYPVVVKTPKPDLWVFKWGLIEQFDVGGWVAERGIEFTFNIWYLNFGGASASNTLLTDTLPSGVDFISADPEPTLGSSRDQLVWDLGTVDSFGFGEIKVKVRPTVTGTLTNRVDISTADAEEEDGLSNDSEFTFKVVTLIAPRITHPRPPSAGGTLLVGPEVRFEGLARAGAEVVLYTGPSQAYSWETATFTSVLTTTTGSDRFFSESASLPDGDHYIYARAFSGTEKSEGGLWSPLHLVVSSTLSVDPDGVGVHTGGQDYAPGGLGGQVGGAAGEPVTITVPLDSPCDPPLSPTLYISNTRTGEGLPPLSPVDTVSAGGTYTYTFVFRAYAGGSYETEFGYVCDDEEEQVPIVIILIDPAGYVYDLNTTGVTYLWPSKPPDDSLVVNATVTTTVRTGDDTWEVWDAQEHDQYNPQVTDRTTSDGVKEPGYYAFFVPSGQYKVHASAPGCTDYESPILTVVNEPVYHNVGLRCTEEAAVGVEYHVYLPLVVR